MSAVFETIAKLGVLGFVAVAFTLLFAFVIVASLLDVPGIREVAPDVQANFFTVLSTIVAGLGGAVAVMFKGRE